MKTIVVKIDTPTDGDLVIVNAEAPNGGKTSAKHLVLGPRTKATLDDNGFVTGSTPVAAQTARDVAEGLAAQIKAEWLPDCVQVSVKDGSNALVIRCSDLFSDVEFSVEVAGNGGTTMAMDEF